MKKFFYFFILGFILLFVNKAEAVLINYDGTGHQYPDEILNFYSGLPGSPVHSEGFMWLDYGGSVSPT